MKNEPLEHVNTFNFLGITIDKQLNWNAHIDKVASKISRSLGILNKLKNILPQSAKTKIYNSLILSHLNYGILLWGYKSTKIQKQQKKAVQIISCKKYNAHTSPLFKTLKLLKFEDIFTLSKLKFYHKYINKILPGNLQNLPFQLNEDVHRYNTRQASSIHVPRYHHGYTKNCIRFDIPETINRAPVNIREKLYTHSLTGLANYVKNYCIEKYQEVCVNTNCYVYANNG